MADSPMIGRTYWVASKRQADPVDIDARFRVTWQEMRDGVLTVGAVRSLPGEDGMDTIMAVDDFDWFREKVDG